VHQVTIVQVVELAVNNSNFLLCLTQGLEFLGNVGKTRVPIHLVPVNLRRARVFREFHYGRMVNHALRELTVAETRSLNRDIGG
jgi:hypothetical protein